MKPILKWAGGKRKYLSKITGFFPQSYNSYHEPFVGAGAVFFSMESDTATINDLNSRLMRFYKVVRDCPDDLIEENKKHEHSEEYFYQAREEFNELLSSVHTDQDRVREASLLLYLNRTCYNGLYRVNSDGEFNTSFGRIKNPNWVQTTRIQSASRLLQNTRMLNKDFKYVLDDTSKGDLVYFDPPYKPRSKTADFTQYTDEGFDQDDQRRLRDTVVELTENNVSVILTNTPSVTELYEKYDVFTIRYVDVRQPINSDPNGRGEKKEALITSVQEEDRVSKTLSNFT